MKIAPLGLAGGRSYDRTNSLRTPTMKESQRLREKTTSSVFVSTCSNAVHAQFHWQHIHATPGHVTSFACSRNTSDRSLAWSHHRRRSTRDRSRSRWNMKHFRQTARGCLLHQYCHGASRSCMQLAQALFSDSWRSSTGHDRSQCTTTKDRSRKKAVMVALWSFLLDRLDVERSVLRFPRPLHASEGALRILAKGNRKSKVFWWGGRFGRSLLCPGRAEKKTRGSCPPTRCLPVDRNKLGPDSWRDEKGVWYRTHTHTELKPCGPPGPRR